MRPGTASATFEDTLAGHLHVTRATGAVAGPRLRHASTNTGKQNKVYITWVITRLQTQGNKTRCTSLGLSRVCKHRATQQGVHHLGYHASTNTGQQNKVYITWVITRLQTQGNKTRCTSLGLSRVYKHRATKQSVHHLGYHASTNTGQQNKVYITWLSRVYKHRATKQGVHHFYKTGAAGRSVAGRRTRHRQVGVLFIHCCCFLN